MNAHDPETALVALFAGRRVALVGPSTSIVGSGAGAEIEAHDLVVRLNHQWPIAPERTTDLGTRMDVLYHCCNPDVSVARFARADFADTHMVFFEDGPQAPTLRIICRELEVPAIDVSGVYRRLNGALGSPPNTGLAAIVHLLEQPIAQLKLFGITFFRDPYYAGYLGHGADPAHWAGGGSPRSIWRHDLERQREYFLQTLAPDSRLSMDERSHRLVVGAGS